MREFPHRGLAYGRANRPPFTQDKPSMNRIRATVSRSIANGRARVPSGAHIYAVSWAMVGLVAPTMLQLVYMVFAARILGATQAGNFFLIVSVATIASSFAGLGGGGLTMRDTARDHAAAPVVLGRALAMSFATFPFLIVPVVMVSRGLTHAGVSFPIIFLIGGAELIPMRNMTTLWSMFIARSEQVRGSLLICLMPLLRLTSILFVFAFPAQQHFVVFSYAYVIASFAALIIGIGYVVSRVGRLPLTLRGFDVRMGISFAMTWLTQALQTESDKIILSLFASPAMVAVYAVGSRLMDGAYMPPRALKNSIQPRLFREGASGPIASYRITLKIMPVTIAYGLFIWAAFALSAPLVVFLFGREYAALGRILPIFGALPLVRSIADFGAEIFQSSDRPEIQAKTQTFATVLRIGLGFILIEQLRLEGAVATALAVNVVSATILWALVWRATHPARGETL